MTVPAAMNQLSIFQTGYSGDPSWYTGVRMRLAATATPTAARKTPRTRFTISMTGLTPPLSGTVEPCGDCTGFAYNAPKGPAFPFLRGDGLSKYGWPFLLFIGVPFFARVFAPIVAEFYTVGSGLSGLHDFTLLESGLRGLVTAVLLGLLYFGVRSMERDTLAPRLGLHDRSRARTGGVQPRRVLHDFLGR